MGFARRRFFLVLGCVALAGVAHADSAFLPAYSIFRTEVWGWYVLQIIIFEAWFIGRGSGLGWVRSLLTSSANNLVTGFGCLCLSLQGFSGFSDSGGTNPNPILDVMTLFVSAALLSGIIETAGWMLGRGNGPQSSTWMKMLGRTVLCHLLAVPLAFCILLTPDRPYRGLEQTTWQARENKLGEVLQTFADKAKRDNVVPRVSGIPELLQKFGTSTLASDTDFRTVPAFNAISATELGFLPEFNRFATGEAHAHPLEWNPAAAGMKLTPKSKVWRSVWLVRFDDPVYGHMAWDLDLVNGDLQLHDRDNNAYDY